MTTILGAAVTAAFAPVAVAQSADCSVTVVGQNDPAQDVAAVAAAVNAPAAGDVKVCLSGTFDFGVSGSQPTTFVAIQPPMLVNSLTIAGLDDEQGRQTRIRNGFQPLRLSPGATLARLSIENLRFVNPTFSAISILRANESVNISGVHVTGVQSFQAGPALLRTGISVSSALAVIAGEITIFDNVIHGGVYGPGDQTLALSAGISLAGAAPGVVNQPFTARVHVAGNRLVNWSGTGIIATAITDATIEGNSIAPGEFANLIPACTQPNGSGIASGISLAGVTSSLIRDNVVNMVPALTGAGAPPQCTAGIVVPGIFAGGSHDNILYRNRVRGSGSYAIVVGTPVVGPGMSAELDNVFALNSVANFTASAATLFLGPGASDNVLIGDFASVDDQSAGSNTIVEQ